MAANNELVERKMTGAKITPSIPRSKNCKFESRSKPLKSGIDKYDKHDILEEMEVRMTQAALHDFQRLPLVIRARVLELFRRLADWPNVSGAKPLKKNWKGHFRCRTGDWRVIVRPAGEILWVVRIDNRRDVYGD